MDTLYLKNLSLVQFKNYTEASLSFSKRINCFVGDNGVGKTNLLDAIHYLSLTKSYFNPVDQQNILHGKEMFMIRGEFERAGRNEKIYCSVRAGKKKVVQRNGKAYDRLADHIGFLPVVMISPADSALILEGSEERRKFMDTVISLYDKSYLHDLLRYNRVLLQRNKVLKNAFKTGLPASDDELALWDNQLIPPGERIFSVRQTFTEKLVPVFQEYYHKISGENETVSLEYVSPLFEMSFPGLLMKNRDKDRILQYTSGGIHKDDLLMKLGGFSLKKTGSQGQQKTFLVALKFAKFAFIRETNDIKPILLLDDIFDKFDPRRVTEIIRLVSENEFGQIFITDTHLDHLEGILKQLDADYKVFKINEEIKIIRQPVS
ncbi:MAG: DNA replication and repair protein RecF [Chlorobi bacterium]|nr:DNA replication and repair protein RecF [Chlorobiota bacterium]